MNTVNDVLDVVPDFADEFEILIVDDASTDLTEEIAIELAHRYPQVSVTRNRRTMGCKQSVQTGLERCLGDVIFVKDDTSPLRPSDLRSMWGMRTDEQLVMAQSAPGEQTTQMQVGPRRANDPDARRPQAAQP
jgi:cellulose synthase/poly-beta-1,6-N-acetylglucosamine synthase-like glycosyltransferase